MIRSRTQTLVAPHEILDGRVDLGALLLEVLAVIPQEKPLRTERTDEIVGLPVPTAADPGHHRQNYIGEATGVTRGIKGVKVPRPSLLPLNLKMRRVESRPQAQGHPIDKRGRRMAAIGLLADAYKRGRKQQRDEQGTEEKNGPNTQIIAIITCQWNQTVT